MDDMDGSHATALDNKISNQVVPVSFSQHLHYLKYFAMTIIAVQYEGSSP